MEQTQTHSYVSVEDPGVIIRELEDDLDDSARRLAKLPPGMRLQNLQSVAYGIDAPVVHRARPFERHVEEWKRFVSGESAFLDKKAIKYLCWVPEIAIDERFLASVDKSRMEMNWRCLAGLVSSCHCQWENLPPECPSILMVNNLLMRYKGSNQALLKWQTNPDALLSQHGPLILAEKFMRRGKSLRSFLDEWRLETQSPFFQNFIEITAARCRTQLVRLPEDLLIVLFRDVLSWPGWRLSAFKKEISALFLHKPMTGRMQETIQRFVIHHKELGDPRLKANLVKWAEVPQQAEDRLIQWLIRENLFVFSDHVYKQGKGWIWQQRATGLEPLAFDQE